MEGESLYFGPNTEECFLLGLNVKGLSYYGLFPKLHILGDTFDKLTAEEADYILGMSEYWKEINMKNVQ